MNASALDFTMGFSGDVLGPIPSDDAVKRVVAFCCSPRSGFLGYDLAGHVADNRAADRSRTLDDLARGHPGWPSHRRKRA